MLWYHYDSIIIGSLLRNKNGQGCALEMILMSKINKWTDLALGTTYQVCLLHSMAEMSKVCQVKKNSQFRVSIAPHLYLVTSSNPVIAEGDIPTEIWPRVVQEFCDMASYLICIYVYKQSIKKTKSCINMLQENLWYHHFVIIRGQTIGDVNRGCMSTRCNYYNR